MGEHWHVGYLVGGQCYDHVHPMKGEDPWLPQTPSYDCPIIILG